MGFVFQRFMLLDALDAVDNVATALLYRGESTSVRRKRATAALERVGLGHRLEHRPSRLSGGEQQRVAIARAIVGNPALILADEPTGNLDSKTSVEIMDLLTDLNRNSGITVLMVTHEPDMAAYARNIIHFRDGLVETIENGVMA